VSRLFFLLFFEQTFERPKHISRSGQFVLALPGLLCHFTRFSKPVFFFSPFFSVIPVPVTWTFRWTYVQVVLLLLAFFPFYNASFIVES